MKDDAAGIGGRLRATLTEDEGFTRLIVSRNRRAYSSAGDMQAQRGLPRQARACSLTTEF